MKINRLLEILIILLNKNGVTARYLADKFNVSVRTIYRDINDLTLSGIPIYTNKGKGGGISLMDNYTINKVLLSQKDRESLLIAVKTLQATKYPEIENTLNKLGAIFKNKTSLDWLDVDFSPWGADQSGDSKFHLIKKSIFEKRIIKCEYVNSYNQKSIRKIEPFKLIYKGHYWYLCAFCLLKNDYRLFKLVRMKNVQLCDDKYDARPLIPLEKLFNMGAHNFVNLHLRFKNDVLYRLYDDFDEKFLTTEGEYTDVRIKLPMNEWIYSYILSYGKSVKVLSPKNIRDEIISKIKENIKNYS